MSQWPGLDLYPEVPMPDDPTWDDIVRLSHVSPYIRAAVMLAERGDWTREQALIRITFALHNAHGKLFNREVDRLMAQPSKPFVMSDKTYLPKAD